MKINKISQKIQYLAKKVSEDEKLYNKINNTILPIGESVIATGMYSLFIEKNNHIEKERKPALHYQNIICGAVGIASGNSINKWIQKHQNKIIDLLEKDSDIKNVQGLINGIKIAMPMAIFSLMLRFLLPVISTPISSKINSKKNYLDIKS